MFPSGGVRMKHMAYCGFDCGECPVYAATERNDGTMQIELAQRYSDGRYAFTPEDMSCTGCRTSGADHNKLCGCCGMRLCARARGAAHCAACADYPCAVVERSLPAGTAGRLRLDALRDKPRD